MKSLNFSFFVTITVAFLSGCGQAKLKVAGQNDPRDKLSCGPRASYTVIEDLNHDHEFEVQEATAVLFPFTGLLSAAENYNYFELSSHILSGPAAQSGRTAVYLYEGPDGPTLGFTHDLAGIESRSAHFTVEIVTSHNDKADKILLSDEPDEFKIADHSESATYYLGRFQYDLNTDGAVIGPFKNSDFRIHFKISTPDPWTGVDVASAKGASHPISTDSNRLSDRQAVEFEIRLQSIDPCLFP